MNCADSTLCIAKLLQTAVLCYWPQWYGAHACVLILLSKSLSLPHAKTPNCQLKTDVDGIVISGLAPGGPALASGHVRIDDIIEQIEGMPAGKTVEEVSCTETRTNAHRFLLLVFLQDFCASDVTGILTTGGRQTEGPGGQPSEMFSSISVISGNVQFFTMLSLYIFPDISDLSDFGKAHLLYNNQNV